MFCGRRSALPATGIGAEANSEKAEGVLTTKLLTKYRDETAFVNEQPASLTNLFVIFKRPGLTAVEARS